MGCADQDTVPPCVDLRCLVLSSPLLPGKEFQVYVSDVLNVLKANVNVCLAGTKHVPLAPHRVPACNREVSFVNLLYVPQPVSR